MLSTSEVAKFANTKLAQFLLSKEGEDALLAPKRPLKRREMDEPRGPSGRWHLEPDYSIPSSLVDRPRTPSGGTSFHFVYETITKVALPLDEDGRPITWCFEQLRMSPVEFEAYIVRDEAVEVVATSPAAHAELDGDVACHFDRSDARTETLGEVRAIVSNISEDPDDRDEFWRRVPDQESSPWLHELHLRHQTDEAWWEALRSNNEIDHGFRDHSLAEHERALEAELSGFEHKSTPFGCDFDLASSILIAVAKLPGFDERNSPVKLEPLRAGRIQFRFVLELPHELSPSGRLEILTEFCRLLGSLEDPIDASGSGMTLGMMYTGANHAPDGHNDARNFHMHVVAHDRPAEIVFDEDGKRWEFADKKLKACRDINLPKKLRKKAAAIVNGVMKAENVGRHYDPRTYKEMGIKRTPTRHLGTNAHALESVGVPTFVGSQNGVSIWRDAERAMLEELERVRKSQDYGAENLKHAFTRAALYDPHRADVDDLLGIITSRKQLSNDLVEERQTLLTFHLNEAKAKSRPVRTIRTCMAYLQDIETGRAKPHLKGQKARITARLKSAQQRLEAIDCALEEHRTGLAEAQARLLQHADILKQFDQTVIRFARDIEQASREDQPQVPLPPELAAGLTETWKRQAAAAAARRMKTREPGPVQDDELIHVEPPMIEGKSIVEQARLMSGEAGEYLPPLDADDAVPPPPTHDQRQAADDTVDSVFTVPAPRPDTPEISDQEGQLNGSELTSRRAFGEVLTLSQSSDEIEPWPPQADQPDPTEKAADDSEKQRPSEPPQPAAFSAGQPPMPATDKPQTERVAEPSMAPSPMPADEDFQVLSKPTSPQSAPNPAPELGAPIDDVSWCEVLAKIERDNLLISRSSSRAFSVGGLTEDERISLEQEGLSAQTEDRLRELFSAQRREVLTVIMWMRQHGRNPEVLRLKDRRAALLRPPSPEFRALVNKHQSHPALVRFCRVEHARRAQAQNLDSPSPPAASQGASGVSTAPSSEVSEAIQPVPSQGPSNDPSTTTTDEISPEVLQAVMDARGQSR